LGPSLSPLKGGEELKPQIEFADELVIVELLGDPPSKANLPRTMT
jgi:hypothetical protein